MRQVAGPPLVLLHFNPRPWSAKVSRTCAQAHPVLTVVNVQAKVVASVVTERLRRRPNQAHHKE